MTRGFLHPSTFREKKEELENSRRLCLFETLCRVFFSENLGGPGNIFQDFAGGQPQNVGTCPLTLIELVTNQMPTIGDVLHKLLEVGGVQQKGGT